MYSRPMDDVVHEVKRLADNGFSEIVLTGIHLGHYGVDFNKGKPKAEWIRLSGLVRRLCELDGDFRVRLSSIEATEVTRELITVMKQYSDRVCPHLHVCLQSGSDRILSRMKRRWSRKHIIDRCELVKSELDMPAFSTDVIVGFPGETEADFEDTLDACRQIGFSKIHMFPFSARKTTPAADMPDQIPKAVKSQRGKIVQGLESELREEYFRQLVGRDLKLLVEKIDEENSTVSGTTCRYAPTTAKIDPAVELQKLDGKMVDVTVLEMADGKLVAEATV
jgi:threonylcarbamoyladenosine tRNA methylthiotransferase MtaB